MPGPEAGHDVAKVPQHVREICCKGCRLQSFDGATMRIKQLPGSLALAWSLACGGIDPALADPRGLWQAKDGGRVRVAACGKALCGTLVSMPTPNDPATGKPWTDKNNRDPAKRSRPMVGLMVLISMQPDGPSRWTGTLYDGERGWTLTGHMIEQGPSTLRVEGCLGPFCGGENMTRVGP